MRQLVDQVALPGHGVGDGDAGHVVARQRVRQQRQERRVRLAEVPHHARRRGAADAQVDVDGARLAGLEVVLEPGPGQVAGLAGGEAGVAGIEDPVVGEAEVIAGQGLAVRPQQARSQTPLHGHVTGGVDDDAAVGHRGHAGGLVGQVAQIVGDGHQAALGGGGDVRLDDLVAVVRVEEGGFLPRANDRHTTGRSRHEARRVGGGGQALAARLGTGIARRVRQSSRRRRRDEEQRDREPTEQRSRAHQLSW